MGMKVGFQKLTQFRMTLPDEVASSTQMMKASYLKNGAPRLAEDISITEIPWTARHGQPEMKQTTRDLVRLELP